MGNFKKYNLIGGWLCFAIAAIVYLLTMEPTASMWDCAEFIATSYKLEVGHPPGAPLFMLLSRFFMIFASPQTAAMMGNAMSSMASAATIMFLFWSITHLARRSMRATEQGLDTAQTALVLGAGFIGAMAYAFTDTFWFSGVEAEVYALSSMFTAVVFWAMLKWENVADEPHADRWIILIAYLTGLAIGVHLLNLLIIPAIVLIYYFKKYPRVTKWGLTKALLLSFAIIITILYIIIPKTVQLGAFVDRIFVNSFGAPVNLGFVIYVLLLFGLLGWGIWYTHRKGKVVLNAVILCLTVIMIGFGSYATVVIRSIANPPMNSNAPNNAYGLLNLLNRDQYGSRPLVSGAVYSSPAIGMTTKEVYYVDGETGKYVSAQTYGEYEYPEGFKFFFPRMHSPKAEHIEAYQNWAGAPQKQIPFGDETIAVPTFGQNLRFFFGYQLNFMYWRYFLWNFVGRQSDIQSTGEITDGNWLSGINFIDEMFLGPQDNLPSEIADNPARNTYFFLPFILGLLGLIYQLNRDGKNFTVVMSIFIMTGIAIAVYLNSPPMEPRERDYVYAGSFYAFSIWIGLGVMAVYNALQKRLVKKQLHAAILATAICLSVPVILITQNWDDHDRSGRYTARDMGYNYLNTVLPNSIIMNFGDNDTFPLWYAQEVEGVRPDVRIMNLSYLGGEWYVDQMKHKYNESDPVPFSLPQSKYMHTNELIRVNNAVSSAITLKQAIDIVRSEDPRTKRTSYTGEMEDFFPATKLLLPVNIQNAIESGIIRAEDAHLALDTIPMTISATSIYRSDLMLLDLLANFDWKRPLYFTVPSALKMFGLDEFLQFDGFAYRLVPIRTPYRSIMDLGRIDTEYLYDNLMNKYRYGGFTDPKVLADYFVQYTFESQRMRGQFARLADQLLAEGDTIRAIEVLDRGMEMVPVSKFRYSYIQTLPVIDAYYNAGQTEKANALLEDYLRVTEEYLSYYARFRGRQAELVSDVMWLQLNTLAELYVRAALRGQEDIAGRIDNFIDQNGFRGAFNQMFTKSGS